jgi:hypothetical protein
MSPVRILIIGDSHVDAVKRAALTLAVDESVAVTAERIARLKDDKPVGDVEFEVFLQRIASLTPRDFVVSMVGGHQYNAFGLVQHPEAFDFHLPERPDLPPLRQREILPYQVLLDQFRSSANGKDGERIRKLRQSTPARVVHVCPPPPKENSDHIMQRHEALFVKQGLLQNGVTPATIRLKLWLLQVGALKVVCTACGVEFLPVPSGAQTPVGYLAPAYSADDATHANLDYAALILQQLKALTSSALITQ